LENVGEEKVWYIDLLWMLSLGYTFRGRQTRFKRLACVIEKQKKEDALLDFLLKACDIGWNHNTSRYERKIHMQRRLKLYKWHCMIKTRKELRKGYNNI